MTASEVLAKAVVDRRYQTGITDDDLQWVADLVNAEVAKEQEAIIEELELAFDMAVHGDYQAGIWYGLKKVQQRKEADDGQRQAADARV